MDFIYTFIDGIIDKYAAAHKDSLLKKRQIKDFLDKNDEHYMRWSAYGALKDTPLDVGVNPNLNYESPNYDGIPDDWLISLKHGTFQDYRVEKTTKKQREAIQDKFMYGSERKDTQNRKVYSAGYMERLNWGFQQGAREYLKPLWTTTAVILAIVVASIGFGGHAYLKHKADVKYWAAINNPQVYTGDGFTEHFPCGQVKTTDDLSSPDLTSNTSQCEYFGGANHEAIDIYKVQVEHFLTNKYDPAAEVACGDPMHYTGSADTQVYYNESRQVDGFNWVICGVGQDPMVARLQNSSTVYTLEALPNTEKNTAADLDTLIRGFQLN